MTPCEFFALMLDSHHLVQCSQHYYLTHDSSFFSALPALYDQLCEKVRKFLAEKQQATSTNVDTLTPALTDTMQNVEAIVSETRFCSKALQDQPPLAMEMSEEDEAFLQIRLSPSTLYTSAFTQQIRNLIDFPSDITLSELHDVMYDTMQEHPVLSLQVTQDHSLNTLQYGDFTGILVVYRSYLSTRSQLLHTDKMCFIQYATKREALIKFTEAVLRKPDTDFNSSLRQKLQRTIELLMKSEASYLQPTIRLERGDVTSLLQAINVSFVVWEPKPTEGNLWHLTQSSLRQRDQVETTKGCIKPSTIETIASPTTAHVVHIDGFFFPMSAHTFSDAEQIITSLLTTLRTELATAIGVSTVLTEEFLPRPPPSPPSSPSSDRPPSPPPPGNSRKRRLPPADAPAYDPQRAENLPSQAVSKRAKGATRKKPNHRRTRYGSDTSDSDVSGDDPNDSDYTSSARPRSKPKRARTATSTKAWIYQHGKETSAPRTAYLHKRPRSISPSPPSQPATPLSSDDDAPVRPQRETREPDRLQDPSAYRELERANVPSTAPIEEQKDLDWDDTGAGEYLVQGRSRLPNSGLGAFAKHSIPHPVRICEYKGIPLSYRKAKSPGYISDYVYTYDSKTLKFAIDAWDGTRVLSAAGLINDSLHQDGPLRWNCRFVTDTATQRVYIETTEPILRGQELYIPYGDIYWRTARWPRHLLELAEAAYVQEDTQVIWKDLIHAAITHPLPGEQRRRRKATEPDDSNVISYKPLKHPWVTTLKPSTDFRGGSWNVGGNPGRVGHSDLIKRFLYQTQISCLFLQDTRFTHAAAKSFVKKHTRRIPKHKGHCNCRCSSPHPATPQKPRSAWWHHRNYPS